jgi:hypothetical protein
MIRLQSFFAAGQRPAFLKARRRRGGCGGSAPQQGADRVHLLRSNGCTIVSIDRLQ